MRDAMVVLEPSNKSAFSLVTLESGVVQLLCESPADRSAWAESIEGNIGALEEAVEAASQLQSRCDSFLDEQERMFVEQEALSSRIAAAQARVPQPNITLDYDFKAILAAAKDAQATGKKGSYVQGRVQSVFTLGKK